MVFKMKALMFLVVLGVMRMRRVNGQIPTQGVPRTPTGAETTRCTPPFGQICSTSSQVSSTTPLPGFFPTWPATLRPNQVQADSATSFISSVQSSWSANATYTTLTGAVYVAAPPEAQYSLAIYGWNWDRIVRTEWYNGGTYNDSGTLVTYGGVNESWREYVVTQEKELQRGFNKIFGLESVGTRLGAGFGGSRYEKVVLGWGVLLLGWIGVWEVLWM